MADPMNDPERVWVVISPHCSCPVQLARIEKRHALSIVENGKVPGSLDEHIAEYISLAAHESALAEQGKRVAELGAELRRVAPMRCLNCGPHIKIDEDGCCVGCGADATEIDGLEGLDTP